MVRLTATVAAAALLLQSCTAHHGHDLAKELKERRAFLDTLESPDLSHCSKAFEKNNLPARIAARRLQIAKELREARGIDHEHYLTARDFASVLATDHHSNMTITNAATGASQVFSKSKAVTLAPEAIEGPFWVTGEMVRRNISEKEPGIDLILDVQLVDVKTCNAVQNTAVEIWHSNVTGVYSGVVSPANSGNANDLTNVNKTFFRGLQMTDKDGVVMFHTKVPGHYGGRTQHIHLMSTHNATQYANKTISGGQISHVGQMYFDQSFIDHIETLPPYTSNTNLKTMNKDDFLMGMAAANDDPVLEYVFLGKSAADGVFAWINVGIDTSANHTAMAAASWGADGGKMNPNQGMGFPGGGFPFPFPTAFPSGFAFPTAFPSGFSFPTAFPSGFPSFPSGFPSFPMSGFPFSFPGMPGATAAPTATSAAPQPSSTMKTTTRA